MTKEKIAVGHQISTSISNLSNCVNEFQNKMVSMPSVFRNSFGVQYEEVLTKAIDAATTAFNAIVIPKIEELEQELKDL
jgi:hypothetical protein